MSNKPDGGPAFPEVVTEYHGSHGEYTQDVHSVGGMSLRDYYAGLAMQSMLTVALTRPTEQGKRDIKALPAACFSVADEMLKARES